jgi:succinate dehydrogenase / fumarate reductase cytochrome b subunit
MIYSGGIVMIFLIIHFINFYFIKLGWVGENAPRIDGEPNFYVIAQQLFSIPGYSILYILLFIILGVHLYHAFGSAFQSLGLNVKKYTHVIERAGLIYSIIIPAGFIIIPLYFLIIK